MSKKKKLRAFLAHPFKANDAAKTVAPNLLDRERFWFSLKAAGVIWFDELVNGSPEVYRWSPNVLEFVRDPNDANDINLQVVLVLRAMCEDMQRPDWA